MQRELCISCLLLCFEDDDDDDGGGGGVQTGLTWLEDFSSARCLFIEQSDSESSRVCVSTQTHKVPLIPCVYLKTKVWRTFMIRLS